MSNLKPCADPRICGVKSHKPGTVCKAEQIRGRRQKGGASAQSSLGAPPPSSASPKREFPEVTLVSPERAGEGWLDMTRKAGDLSYEEVARHLERDPLAKHLDLEDNISLGSTHLVRAVEPFSTGNMEVSPGDYVPVQLDRRSPQMIVPPSKWDEQRRGWEPIQDVDDHLPRVIDRSEEVEEEAARLEESFVQGKEERVDVNVDGIPFTFTMNGEGEYESQAAHISTTSPDGTELHGWITRVGGRKDSCYLADEDEVKITPSDPSRGGFEDPRSDRRTWQERGFSSYEESLFERSVEERHAKTVFRYQQGIEQAVRTYYKVREGIDEWRRTGDRARLREAMRALSQARVDGDN